MKNQWLLWIQSLIEGKAGMKIRHPFEWIEEYHFLKVFIAGCILTVVVAVGLQLLGSSLITETAPLGIISFEFAGDMDSAQAILASWRHELRVYAGLNLGVDYLFMIAYGVTIGLGCVLVAQKWQDKQSKFVMMGVLLAWGSIGAAVFDAFENLALIQILLGSLNEVLPVVAKLCAGTKFFLVGAGLLYLLGGTLIPLFAPLKKNK